MKALNLIPPIWPDPGDSTEELNKALRKWKMIGPPWWLPGRPWPPNGDKPWSLPPEISRNFLPKIFEEDANKIARVLEFPKGGHITYFHMYMSQINFDGTLLRKCLAIIMILKNFKKNIISKL